MSTWTSVAKPTGAPYTLQNFPGQQTYDDAGLTYDDASTYYDSVNYTAWTLPDNPNVAWNLDRASLTASFSTAAKTTNPEALFFKSDGTKMYLTADDGDSFVYQYNLSTAWDITTAAFSQSKDIQVNVRYPDALFFRSDGLKMYVGDSQTVGFGVSSIVEYDLSTAWDISTATYLQRVNLLEVASIGGLYFSPDGTRTYATDYSGIRQVLQYNLSIPWNVSTISLKQIVSINGIFSTPDGIFMKSDGSQLYIVDANLPNRVAQYNLVVPWDIGTLVLDKTFIFSTTPDVNSYAIYWSDDGMRFFVVFDTDNTIKQYDLTEQWSYAVDPTS